PSNQTAAQRPLLLRNQKPKGQVTAMKFFTPELFVALNSQREDSVEEALEKWDVARDEYRKQLAMIENELPKSFVKLGKTVALHDSLVEHPASPVLTISQTDDEREQSRAIISLRLEHVDLDL